MKIKNTEFIEKLIIKGILNDEKYCALVMSALDITLFDNINASVIFKEVTSHFREYHELPSKDILVNVIPQNQIDQCIEYINEIDSVDFNLAQNNEFLITETDSWIKQKALQNAILDSADILTSRK